MGGNLGDKRKTSFVFLEYFNEAYIRAIGDFRLTSIVLIILNKNKNKHLRERTIYNHQLIHLQYSTTTMRLHCPTEADIDFKLNIDSPFKNINGVVPFITKQCPESVLNTDTDQREVRGKYDKFSLTMFTSDDRDCCDFKAWLNPAGDGIYTVGPATSGVWFRNSLKSMFSVSTDPKVFIPRCETTWHKVLNLMRWKTKDDNEIVIHWKLPEGIICTNEHFNIQTKGAEVPHGRSLLPKYKMHGFDMSTSAPAVYSTTTMITFECFIVNADFVDLALEETKPDVNGMQDIFKTMAVG